MHWSVILSNYDDYIPWFTTTTTNEMIFREHWSNPSISLSLDYDDDDDEDGDDDYYDDYYDCHRWNILKHISHINARHLNNQMNFDKRPTTSTTWKASILLCQQFLELNP